MTGVAPATRQRPALAAAPSGSTPPEVRDDTQGTVMPFRVGDRIAAPHLIPGLACEILEVRPTGYTWRYVPRDAAPGMPLDGNPLTHYRSEASDDPLFERGWRVVSRSAPCDDAKASVRRDRGA